MSSRNRPVESLQQAQSSGTGEVRGNPAGSVSRAVAQYTIDARLNAFFEQSSEPGGSSGHSRSFEGSSGSVPEQQISAYLSKIQRGGCVQTFGCLIAVHEATFRVIAFSENSREMLGFSLQSVPSLENSEVLTIGTHIRSLFTSPAVSLLEKAFGAREITLLNPIWVLSKNSGKPFYAILHRIDVGVVIDLEPAKTEDPALSVAGAVQSQKLAVRAISKLQSLPGGDVRLLCDAVVENVRELTGYDRVMVYKFHEDEHGEVFAESRRPDMDSYIGLHYPSTDIPQASRFLFKQSKVRTIVDCRASPARIIQDGELVQPLCLVGSTLRAAHGCHTQYMVNMGIIASLVLAVVIHGNEEETVTGRNPTKLWGLVVCHHSSPRLISFPLRYACEFLMQAFGLQLNMELQLAYQLEEKHVLRTQTLLCDMLLRDSPVGIITQNPSIMDLVKCNGAALYYHNKYYTLGITPSETQINDIIAWLLTVHGESMTGLSTDSLADAGYPLASSLEDGVCGMTVAYITPRDFLFWFRSHTAKEIKWGGAKHRPEDKDDAQKMNPRTSFNAFLEVVKSQSLPWENAELDAIHSLQLILRDSMRDAEASSVRSQMEGIDFCRADELSSVAREIVRLIETATAPIFSVDTEGNINGWNAKITEISGLSVEEAMGKPLVDLVHEESKNGIVKLLHSALSGEKDENVEVKMKTTHEKSVYVVINACASKDRKRKIVGACFIGQDVTFEKLVMDKFTRIQHDYRAIVHSPNPLIPPIFASDEDARCSEWNLAMEKLTGWGRGEVVGRNLAAEVFGNCCRLKGTGSLTRLMIVLHSAIAGQDTEKFPFAFFSRNGEYVQVLLTVYKKADAEGRINGAFCFLQIASPELRHAMKLQRQQERNHAARKKELMYLCQEVKNPLRGIQFTNSLLGSTELTDEQTQFLDTSAACERQMLRIINDAGSERIEDGSVQLLKGEFLLGSAVDAVVSQVMVVLRERKVDLIRDIPEDVKTMLVYGDQVRLQQVLAEFLLSIALSAPLETWVQLFLHPSLVQRSEGHSVSNVEIKIGCPGDGLPAELTEDMFRRSRCTTQEGMCLRICRRILNSMDGEIRYVRASEDTSHFHIDVLLPLAQPQPR